MSMSKEQKAKDLWSREGGHCVSALVDTIADGVNVLIRPDKFANLHDLSYQAFELRCASEDYEEAAIQAGWSRRAATPGMEAYFYHQDRCLSWTCDTWQELCERYEIDAYEREVFEHWIVSEWLGKKLEAKGEKVDYDFAGLTVWARTTTGQAVYADHVIEQIALDLYNSA